LWFTGDSWAYSFGKINHDILMILMLPIMQVAGWSKAYSIDALRHRAGQTGTRPWAIALMAFIVALCMFSAALAKATTGWLDPHSHSVHAHLLFNYFVISRTNWLIKPVLFIHSGAFWEFFDYSTILLEAAFLFTVAWRPAFRVVCAFACFFHLGIAVTMEIAYVSNLIAYAAFFDWSVLEHRVPHLARAWNWILERVSPLRLVGLSGAVTFIYLKFGNPLGILFPQEWDPPGVLVCALAALLATVFLSKMVRNHSLRIAQAFRRSKIASS
jgi:hypothetical protein